jgi:hypothetical protein
MPLPDVAQILNNIGVGLMFQNICVPLLQLKHDMCFIAKANYGHLHILMVLQANASGILLHDHVTVISVCINIADASSFFEWS